jgi:uncharacterized damage-inducible protein DinB
MSAPDSIPAFITPATFLAHWQGHRRLTRRIIAAFPADEFGTLTLGNMRPFNAMAAELLGMATPMARGVLTGEWGTYSDGDSMSQSDILKAWDQTTGELDVLFPQIPVARFQETMTAFGQWTMPAHELFHYAIDNEIHHRGQGYVYLRALGIEPPPFWERS